MKFISCIIFLLELSFVLGIEFNAFGLTKSSDILKVELAEAVNKIIGSIGYIQFYDVSEQIHVFPINPIVTLSNIEMSGLKFVNHLDASQIEYTATESAATIKGKALTISMDAKFSCKWTYKIGGSTMYSGTYTATLGTEKPEIEFMFVNDKPTSVGKIGFGWKITASEVKGFGAFAMVKNTVNDIVKNKLFSIFNTEINRYNDIVVNSMIYNYFFRNMPLLVPTKMTDKLSLKNVFTKFLVSNDEKHDSLHFVYNSSIYYAIGHYEVPFNGSFDSSYTKSGITMHLGVRQLDDLFELLRKNASETHFVIKPEDQVKLFGYALSVNSLVPFYPRLGEEYDPELTIDFSCDMMDSLSYHKKYMVDCKFVLHDDPNEVLFVIEGLEWGCNRKLEPIQDTEKTWLEMKLTDFRFENLKVKNPIMPTYVQKQLLSFLQPMAKFPENSMYPVPLLGNGLTWKLEESKTNDNGDIAIIFSKH